VKEHVERESAELIVLLLPGVEDQELITSRFRGIRDVVDRLGITTVDLMDTYASVPDIETVRISWADLHPNAVGHRLIADNLVRKLRRQPAACAALIGQKDSIR
jgi:lysophospholipase L1-like esterase